MRRTPPTDIPCPRCGAPVGSEQAWCLTCGAPARTRMRPTPNWKLPLLAIAAIVLVVAGGTVGAFVALTTDNEAPKASTISTATVPAATPPPAPTATPTDPTAAPNPDSVAPPPVTTATTTAPVPPAETTSTTGPTPPPPTTTGGD